MSSARSVGLLPQRLGDHMIKKIKLFVRKNRKLTSFLSIFAVVVLVGIAVTIAYFQDTETSTGNRFVAGKLNLKIDNTCHYNGKVCSYNENLQKYVWEGTDEECFCTWEASDLTNELFFNFPDVKPGDFGEDTISLHIDNNDAWVCAEVANLESSDNGCETPETKAGDVSCNNPGVGEGELHNYLLFSFWRDTDCNNILDAGEAVLATDQIAVEGKLAVADATTGGGPLTGGETYCLGVSWRVPITASNIIQSDSLTGDISFSAVQARHMADFTCSDAEPLPTAVILPTSTPTSAPTVRCISSGQCDDNNLCTNDVCDQEGFCQYVFNNVSCDDGIFCNGTDICNLGSCGHTGDPCPGPDGDSNCSESCNESVDNCTANDPNGVNCLGGYCSVGQCVISAPTSTPAPVSAGSVWINEIHYDNDGTDSGEGVEIAGVAGSNLSGWQLYFYNGVSPFRTYMSPVPLSGTIPDQDSGYGTLWFGAPGVQNGSPDGIALVDSNGIAVQFLSYEGVFTAVDGPANGMVSTDIGVFQPDTTLAGLTLQLQGSGNSYADFVWAGPVTQSRGAVNTGQAFVP